MQKKDESVLQSQGLTQRSMSPVRQSKGLMRQSMRSERYAMSDVRQPMSAVRQPMSAVRRPKRVSRRTSFEYGDERGRNLLEVFNGELGAMPGEKIEKVLERAVNRPARRFWVSEERAVRVVSSMERRGLPAGGHPLKREMFEEISRRCRALAVEHPEWSLSRRVYHVVNNEAPRFYLSVSSAHVIVCKERRRCRREQERRLWRLSQVSR